MKMLIACVAKVLLFIVPIGSQAQEMSEIQKIGACAGYHVFWFALSTRLGSPNDAANSDRIVAQLDSSYRGNPQHRDAKSRALELCTQAFPNNPTLVKSFAGFCVEKGIPIGANTRR